MTAVAVDLPGLRVDLAAGDHKYLQSPLYNPSQRIALDTVGSDGTQTRMVFGGGALVVFGRYPDGEQFVDRASKIGNDKLVMLTSEITIGEYDDRFNGKVTRIATEYKVGNVTVEEEIRDQNPFTIADGIMDRVAPLKGQRLEGTGTFEVAKSRSRGLSIEDIVENGYDDADMQRALQPDEKIFFSSGELLEYERRLIEFIDDMEQKNPYPETRKFRGELQSNPFTGIGWQHVNSTGFIRSRNEGSKDDPSARIYLSPRYGMDMLAIFEEIFSQADREGLAFKAKVFATEIDALGDDRKHGQMGFWLTKRHRVDPMLFYPLEGSKDRLLEIALDVYNKHKNSFDGSRCGSVPAEILPGLAIGDEPSGVSGKESLTSHRKKFIETAQKLAGKHTEASASDERRKKTYLSALRFVADKMGIDPDNIAFNKQ